jgi:hypothetical protein
MLGLERGENVCSLTRKVMNEYVERERRGFKDAICDNVDLIYYISNFTENIPNIVCV